MIPGTVSKLTETTVASAASIVAKSDIVRVTGNTQVDTIVPPFGGANNVSIWVIAITAGNLVVSAAGNVLIGQTLITNRLYIFVWSKTTQKWYIHGVV